jgi:hypothetical protein
MTRHEQVMVRLHEETERMHQKSHRTRGNSGYILRLVSEVKRKCCKDCGNARQVELHHEDGNWRNYSLDNLNWYCPEHHQHRDNILQEKHNMKNTVKRTYIAWNTRNKTLLRDNIDHRRISDPRSSMTAVYADIAKNSQKIFGKKLTAKHIQKRAYALGVAPGSRARVTSPTRATASGVTLMFQGRSITEEMLQKALKLYDVVYNT